MKTLYLAVALSAFVLSSLNAEITAGANATATGQNDVPAPAPYQIVGRGANHKVWRRQVYEQLPNGKTVQNAREYIEMASGMHYKNANGNWVESKEVIEPFAGGAIAQQGQYQVIFANNLNSTGAIDQQTPDGKRLRSNILGLAYYDSSSGQSVMIAQVQDSPGELISANQVLYTNAFEGVKADVRYTYKKGSFEQDVILREQPPTPESLGLNSNSTEIQVLTEFISPPELVASRIQNVTPVEQDISWGAMRLGSGKAFDLDNPPTSGRLVTVDRQYTTLDGRNILLERVPLHNIRASLSKLPLQASLNVRRPLFALKQLALPKTPSTTAVKAPLKLAINSPSKPGYVLDYVELVSDPGGVTFQADMTYYISDVVNIDGTAIFEGGCVIKFDTSAVLYLAINGLGICESAPNRPVIFTSQNDNTVGQSISDGSALFYYWTGLAGSGCDNVAWHDLRFKYANFGMDVRSLHLSDSQFVDCLYPIVLDQAAGGSLAATNVLIEHSGTAISGANFNAMVNQLTVNDCTNLTFDWGSYTSSVLATTNSLLVNVQAIGPGNLHSNYTARLTDTGGTILQTNGDGSAYLASGSPYRNAGTTGVGAATLADLATLTTYPPIVCSNTVFGANLTLYPQAQRDTNQFPALGYHYPPLDYVVAVATVSNNITLTLAPGTVLGWYHAHSGGSGLSLKEGANLIGAGTATQPCWVTHTALVQEGNGNWETISGSPGLLFAGDNTGSQPQMNCHFTKMSGLNFTANLFWDNYYHGQGNFTHCEFYNGSIAALESDLYFTNCLVYRGTTTMWGNADATTFTFQNCTFYNGEFLASRSTGQPPSFWTFKNTAFDGTGFQFNDDSGGDPSDTAFDYNSYNTDNLSWEGNTYYTPLAGTLEVTGAHDVSVTDYGWQSSWFGDFYLPPGSALIDAGSVTADQVQLYHFTTQTNQVPETNSIVDIGYHYVATDAFGNPLDTDGDGIPDYLEDSNGDGVFDTGDLGDWLINRFNNLSRSSVLQVFTPLK